MGPSKDDWKAAGKPHSADGLQWRAAHCAPSQRQTGKLMSMLEKAEWGSFDPFEVGTLFRMPT